LHHFLLEWSAIQTYVDAAAHLLKTPTRAERSFLPQEFAMRLAAIHSLIDTSAQGGAARAAIRPGLLGRLFAAAQSWLARRAVLAELHDLDDRTLADLCIHPGDFRAIADGTYAREGGAHDRQAPR
jgi:uncharacterized protein YjiS (DUF1127 family)